MDIKHDSLYKEHEDINNVMYASLLDPRKVIELCLPVPQPVPPKEE